MDQERLDGNISRRSMLKRIGAGAAIAWTAPVLTSLRTPAFGQRYGACAEPCDDDCQQGGIDVCGAGPGPSGTCHCSRTVDGGCLCWDNFLCANSPTCTGNSDCPAGCFCISAANCCGVQKCACPCGSGIITSAGTGASGGSR